MTASRPTRARRLNWGTRHRAKRTEHTTIARLRPECRTAAATFVEELAGVGRHSFHLGRAAARRVWADRRYWPIATLPQEFMSANARWPQVVGATLYLKR